MSPSGSMRPRENKGFLHFVHATNSTTLDQMDQLRSGTAYLIRNMSRIVAEYEVRMNAVGTVTLHKDNYPVQKKLNNTFSLQ